MSSFTFDPSKPSPFQRLISGRVGAPVSNATTAAGERQNSGASVFKEVPAADGGTDSAPPARAALSGLSTAVKNLSDSTDALASVGDAVDEVQRSNKQASEASVRDVQAAAQVADDLQNRIRDDLKRASAAQGKGLSMDSVQRFLG